MQKTVTFIVHNITRDFLTDHLKGQFRFSVIDSSLIGTPKERGSIHTVEVTMTDYLMDHWRLAGAVDPTIVTDDMIKVAFQVAEDYQSPTRKKAAQPGAATDLAAERLTVSHLSLYPFSVPLKAI